MNRWGKLIELLIVVAVALLAAFGLIMGYQAYCRAYGCGGAIGTSTATDAERALIKSQLDACDANPTAAGCTCYSIGANGQSHEYNVDFSFYRWTPERAQPRALIGIKVRSPYAATGYENPLNNVFVYPSLPVSEYRNSDSDAPSGPCRPVVDSSGQVAEGYCAFSPTQRTDYRIFISNLSGTPLSYCLAHNAGTIYH